MILEELWKDDVCRSCMTRLATEGAAAGGGVFGDYAGCVLNGLIYLFKVQPAWVMLVQVCGHCVISRHSTKSWSK